MRQRQAGPALSRGQNGRRRHAVCSGHEPSNQRRLARSVRGGIDVSFDRIAGLMFREGGGLGRVAVAVDESKIRIAREQAVRLSAKKLRPGGADPSWCRPETRAAKDVRDGSGRHAHPEPEQFSLNAHVTPAGVLTPQTNDQAGGHVGQRRTPGATASPPPPKKRPMPATKRPRAHHETGPPLARQQQTTRRRQERPVSGRVVRLLPSSAQNRKLVAEHHDLQIALAADSHDHPDQPAQTPVQQAHRHDAQSEPPRPHPRIKPALGQDRVSLPHTFRPTDGSPSLTMLPNWISRSGAQAGDTVSAFVTPKAMSGASQSSTARASTTAAASSTPDSPQGTRHPSAPAVLRLAPSDPIEAMQNGSIAGKEPIRLVESKCARLPVHGAVPAGA
jgi:hypothetical protein